MHPKCQSLLEHLAEREALASAYLFYGQPEAGQEEAPRVLAERFLSLNTSSQHPDFIQLIPEGSTLKIEDIRHIQKEIQFGPRQGRWLFLHIPNAHTMTSQAANAFLKTLEEPPEHVSIFLTTHHADAIIPTIHSRCQKLFFPTQTQSRVSPTISFSEFSQKSMLEKLLFAQTLSEDKQVVLDTLYAWIYEINQQNPPLNSPLFQTQEILADKVIDLSYNVNLRLQLEALFLKLS